MKKLLVAAFVILIFSSQAFAQNDTKALLNGVWACDVAKTMPLLDYSEQTMEMRMLLEEYHLFFDTVNMTMGMVIEGKKVATGGFKFIDNSETTLTLFTQDESMFIIEFSDPNSMILYSPYNKKSGTLYFNRVIE